MSTPIVYKSQELLLIAKNNLIKQENNIEVLEQIKFDSKGFGLPSLTIESFILFKKLENNNLHIAKTENKDIVMILSEENFQEFIKDFPITIQAKLAPILEKINLPKKPKNKFH